MMTVNPRERFRRFLACMMPSIVMMLLQNAAAIFAAQVYVIRLFMRAKEELKGDFTNRLVESLSSPGYTVSTLLVYSVIGCLVFFFWYRAMFKKEQIALTSKDTLKGYSPSLYVGILVFVIALNYICQFLVLILAKSHPEWVEWFEKMMASIDLGSEKMFVPAIVYTVLLGPVCEELCFRGLTLSMTRRMMTPGLANVVQALLFGGIHANPLQSAYAVVVGWLFGKLYLETDNLLIVVLAHISFNAAGTFFSKFFVVGRTPFSFFSILFTSMMAAYFGYLLILKAQQDKAGEVPAGE